MWPSYTWVVIPQVSELRNTKDCWQHSSCEDITSIPDPENSHTSSSLQQLQDIFTDQTSWTSTHQICQWTVFQRVPDQFTNKRWWYCDINTATNRVSPLCSRWQEFFNFGETPARFRWIPAPDCLIVQPRLRRLQRRRWCWVHKCLCGLVLQMHTQHRQDWLTANCPKMCKQFIIKETRTLSPWIQMCKLELTHTATQRVWFDVYLPVPCYTKNGLLIPPGFSLSNICLTHQLYVWNLNHLIETSTICL